MRSARHLLIAILLCSALSARAQSLRIDGGGLRVVSRTTAANVCGGTAYSPSVLIDPNPAVAGRREVLYTMGGVLSDPCSGTTLMDPARFGDRIWYQYKDRYGRWRGNSGDGTIVVDRNTFPWMADEAYLRTHPESHVGHVGSPSVVKIGERYFMTFVATIDDQNLCAGDHGYVGTGCGSCVKPWSYFVLMWATSEDGITWQIHERTKPVRSNRALDAALLWSLPGRGDSVGRSAFEGITRASTVVRVEPDGTYFYSVITYWGTFEVKTAVTRWKYDPASESGVSEDPQIFDPYSHLWESCHQRELPAWLNGKNHRGDLLDGITASISTITTVPGYRYIATFSGATKVPSRLGPAGIGNIIQYRLSDDLITWSDIGTVGSDLPLFADGTSYDNSVLDPIYVERPDGSYIFYFASADGDPAEGIERDGVHDCARADHEMGAMSAYLGLGIYEGRGAQPGSGTFWRIRPLRNDR